MASRGFERATIAEIASAAGLAPGLVHYHFASKQEILLALVENLSALWRERAARTLRPESRARERLAHLLDAWLALDDRADGDAVACWVVLGAEALRQPDVRELYVAAVQDAASSLSRLVRAALEEEGRATRESGAIAAGVMAAIDGYLKLGVLTSGVVPRASAARTLRAMAFGALDAQPLRNKVHHE